MVKKAKKQDTKGMEKCLSFFPFKYKEENIPINNCFPDPYEHIYYQLKPLQVKTCMMFFAASANRPSACAYLMPVNDGHVRKGIPMTVAEVKEDKLIDYKYWIIDGQHSIYAAKMLCYQEEKKSRNLKDLRRVYKERKARIVVDAPPHVSTAILAIANKEDKALYVKQPYSEILKHLRSQWIFKGCPPKLGQGEKEGAKS